MAQVDRDGIVFAEALRQVLGNPAGEGANAIMEGYVVVHPNGSHGRKGKSKPPGPAPGPRPEVEAFNRLPLVTQHLRGMMLAVGLDPKPTVLVRYVASRDAKVSFDTAYRHLKGDVTNEINDKTRRAYAKAFGYADVDSIVTPGHLSRWRPAAEVIASIEAEAENYPAAADVDDVDEAATIKLAEAVADLRSVWNTRLGGLAAFAIRRLKRHASAPSESLAALPPPVPVPASE